MNSKKGVELSLTTVIIFVIALIVLVVVLLIIFNVSNPITNLFKDQADLVTKMVPQR